MPQRRSFSFAILALVVLAVASGAPLIRIPILTHAVLAAFPAAMGIPIGVPPVWVPGSEPILMWLVNIVAAAVMVVAARRVMVRHDPPPGAGRGWVWRKVAWATITALVLANIIRTVGWTFYTEPSLTIYAAYVGLTALLSAIAGAALGAVIGGVAALLSPARVAAQSRVAAGAHS